jgi:hypothetical protein
MMANYQIASGSESYGAAPSPRESESAFRMAS